MALRPVTNSKAILNHALDLQRFSLANYLRFARPWAHESDRSLLSVVFGIAEAQVENATRVGELLVERHASAKPGTFPIRFTGLNDVSVRHVARQIVDDLERNIHDLRWCAEALRNDDTASHIMQAILRDEQRHLQVLRDELNLVRDGESPSQQPNVLSTPGMQNIYGDGLNGRTNEHGALDKNSHAARSLRPSPKNRQKRDLEPSPALALRG